MRLWSPGDKPLLTVRSFFGVHHVVETAHRSHYLLIDGTTVHGAEQVRDAAGMPILGKPELQTYYTQGAQSRKRLRRHAARKAPSARSPLSALGPELSGLFPTWR